MYLGYAICIAAATALLLVLGTLAAISIVFYVWGE